MDEEELQLSDDGEFWWDGEEWQPVRSKLEEFGDGGEAPADAGSLGSFASYFTPDYESVPDESGNAEIGEVV